MSKTLEAILITAIIILFGVSFALVGEIGFKKQEVVTCESLVVQSKEGLTGFFVTKAQSQECASIGIIINAPIKN